MNIQLSISLLASDRAASLERCLDSLRSLMMQVPSELIIVYTGTDEKVREIASRYTDQVIPFQWCNDFSAARNVGLKAAKGEWFLYIDDDEWFEDTAEIRDFFLTGEYRSFGWACYKQRNYLNWDGIQHSDYHAFRMVRIEPDTHFENPIHEELVPRPDPCKYFESYVHHYGYIVEKKSDMGKPARNIPMLKEEIRRDPSHIKNYIQLANEYCLTDNWKKAEEICRKTHRLIRGTGDHSYRRWLQVYLAEILLHEGNAERAEREIVSILEKEEPCELVRLCLYNSLITLYTVLDKPEGTLHYGTSFEDVLVYMEQNPGLWKQQEYGDVNEAKVTAPDKLFLGRMRCTEAALKLEDSEKAAYFLNLLPWGEEYWMQQYYPLFDQWKGKYGVHFQALIEKCPTDAPYIRLQKAWSLKPDKDSAIRLNEFRQCLKDTESLYLRQQVVKEAISSGMDLSAFIDILNVEIWKICSVRIVDETPLYELPDIQKAAQELTKKASVHGLWISKLVWEKELIRGYFSGKELIEALSEYCRCVVQFYREQYREELFSEEGQSLLPWDCRFAVLVAEGLERIEGMDYPEAVRRFRSALRYYPGMTGVLHEIIRLMTGQANNPAQNAGPEFQMLAGQMKEALKAMLAKGQYAEAMSVAAQLSSLLPEDLEMLRLRQKILQETAR